MSKEATGIVLEILGQNAKVKVNRHGECSNCGACPGDSAMVLDVCNKLYAKPGQRVLIDIPEINIIMAAFIVYLLPVIATALGFIMGYFLSSYFNLNSSAFEIFFTVLFFILSSITIKKIDNFLKSGAGTQPRIIKVFQ